MNVNEAQWRKAIARMVKDTYLEEVSEELLAIAYLGIPARKELLKISRAQRSIHSNSKLSNQIKSAKSNYSCRQDSL